MDSVILEAFIVKKKEYSPLVASIFPQRKELLRFWSEAGDRLPDWRQNSCYTCLRHVPLRFIRRSCICC
jgi:hypothetical protein